MGTIVARSRGLLRWPAVVAGLVLVAACIPQNEGAVAEVEDASASGSKPPEFPETGRVPDDLLVEGLVWDFTDAPADLNLWVPSAEEARCAAEKIVANLGVRISDLGYLPDTSGASLNDLALSATERESAAALFESCVDTTQAMASLLIGQRSMSPADAECMAQGLVDEGLMSDIIAAWAFGRQVDPFDGEGTFAVALLSHANICLPPTAFYWPGVDLPGDEEIVGVDEGSGSESGEELPGFAGTTTPTTEAVSTGSEADSGNTGEP